ncbi:MAG TPA: IclR family transcriptional regulator [Burkholderiaceae bacterium]|nr:IclR family transcriptional regulator [Burkholderiaceae bacterium]
MNKHIMETPAASPGAQTIRRAIRALKLVAAQPAAGIRLVDFAAQMELERPTAHRLLKALTAEGMLTQHPDSRRYSLGSLVFELGLAAAHQFNLRDICQPVLSMLAEQTGDTSFLFVRSGDDAICIARTQGAYPIQTPAVPVGARQPLGVNAGGLALLSALPRREVEEIMEAVAPRLSIYGNLDAEQMFEHWTRARQAGYALIGNRAVPGVTAIGLPVMSENGLPIAAITIAAISSRMTEARVAEILPLLKNAAQEMARLLRQ